MKYNDRDLPKDKSCNHLQLKIKLLREMMKVITRDYNYAFIFLIIFLWANFKKRWREYYAHRNIRENEDVIRIHILFNIFYHQADPNKYFSFNLLLNMGSACKELSFWSLPQEPFPCGSKSRSFKSSKALEDVPHGRALENEGFFSQWLVRE